METVGRKSFFALALTAWFCSQIGSAFLRLYLDVANSRLDLLYRFYGPKSELFVSETQYGRNLPFEVNAKGQQASAP